MMDSIEKALHQMESAANASRYSTDYTDHIDSDRFKLVATEFAVLSLTLSLRMALKSLREIKDGDTIVGPKTCARNAILDINDLFEKRAK